MRAILTMGLTLAVTTLCLALALGAWAQPAPTCGGNRAMVVKELEKKYGETIRIVGLTTDGGVLEVYASEEKGTWTILVTSPEGRTCLVSAGHAWETVAPPKPGAPA